MREILFRGKRIDNGEWVFGYYIKATHNWNEKGIHEDWIATDTVQNGGWCNVRGKHAVDPSTVGQFTGLTDKNGKKIFEGDFVKEQDVVHNGEIQIPGHIFSVVMRNGCWCVIPIYDTDEWDFLNSYLPFLEVIGNIHDNSELLKEA